MFKLMFNEEYSAENGPGTEHCSTGELLLLGLPWIQLHSSSLTSFRNAYPQHDAATTLLPLVNWVSWELFCIFG